MIENIGNTLLTYTVTTVEDNGTPGWLSILPLLPDRFLLRPGRMEVGDVRLNANLMTATGNDYGRLHFDGNDPDNLPKDIEIELIVADTLVWPTWDTW